MTEQPLVRPLFLGPIDVIGDVHGEIGALRALLAHLGYRDGVHPEGRRLVFLGDLTDRGPDSPAVVDLVASLLARGLAQCAMGNHELNILLGKERHGNGWYYGKREVLDRSGHIVPQVLADEAVRSRAFELFAHLPLVLEREDLRIVHACWDAAAVEQVRSETDAISVYRRCEAAIVEDLDERNVVDPIARSLAKQNGNPVKVLTSGLEGRAAKPFYAGGKMRDEGRARWWDEYADGVCCVCGHYWRTSLPGEDVEEFFDPARPFAALGNGRVLCIDYSVGKRWRERLSGTSEGFRTALAALRWPERLLVFDDGRIEPVSGLDAGKQQ